MSTEGSHTVKKSHSIKYSYSNSYVSIFTISKITVQPFFDFLRLKRSILFRIRVLWQKESTKGGRRISVPDSFGKDDCCFVFLSKTQQLS